MSRSIVGGLVAGPTGAVLGAFSGNKSYDAVSKMAVVLYFNNNYSKQLNYISTETKIDSMYYRDEQEKMQRFCVRLDKILVENENNEPTTLSTPTNSADELRKLKSLLDDSILTEEEFAAKKKQILGI